MRRPLLSYALLASLAGCSAPAAGTPPEPRVAPSPAVAVASASPTPKPTYGSMRLELRVAATGGPIAAEQDLDVISLEDLELVQGAEPDRPSLSRLFGQGAGDSHELRVMSPGTHQITLKAFSKAVVQIGVVTFTLPIDVEAKPPVWRIGAVVEPNPKVGQRVATATYALALMPDWPEMGAKPPTIEPATRVVFAAAPEPATWPTACADQFVAAERDGDGQVSLAEYLATTNDPPGAAPLKPVETPRPVLAQVAAFQALDQDGDGRLTRLELCGSAAK